MANREEKIQREADETARSVERAVLAGKTPAIPSETPSILSTKTHAEQHQIHDAAVDAELKARQLKELRDGQGG